MKSDEVLNDELLKKVYGFLGPLKCEEPDVEKCLKVLEARIWKRSEKSRLLRKYAFAFICVAAFCSVSLHLM